MKVYSPFCPLPHLALFGYSLPSPIKGSRIADAGKEAPLENAENLCQSEQTLLIK